LQFRSDINGLRAIAVIAVVLFHFNPTWVPGGFAGVDVFFVISGFLMTRIIFNSLEHNNFSLTQFYLDRARRIIPALAFLCLFLLIIGWWLLLDYDYYKLSKHSLGSVSFVSNITYWLEAGYFDGSAIEKWLLHTWSLSAEWQFYVLYPIFLVLMANFMPLRRIKLIILFGTVISFIFSVAATMRFPDPAYYLLPTRVWELTLGGVAYLYPISVVTFLNKTIWMRVMQWLGLVMIFSSYFFISKDNLWPGYLAFLPVFGAFLVIQAHNQHSLFINHIALQKIGLWSYSIYLWHWPIVVFINNYLEVNIRTILLGIAVAVLLGFLSYQLIESHVRKLKHTLLLLIATASLSTLVYINQGHFSIRAASLDPANKITEVYNNYKMDPTNWFRLCNAKSRLVKTGKLGVEKHCVDQGEQQGGIFLWGDSHIGAISPGIRTFIPTHIPVYQLASSGCEPSFNMKRTGSNVYTLGCNYSNDLAYKVIQKIKPNVVVMGMRKNHQKMDWEKTIKILKYFGVEKIVVLGPVPQWTVSLPRLYVKKHLSQEAIADSRFVIELVNTNHIMKQRLASFSSVSYVDILSELCSFDTQIPKCKVKVGDTFISYDYGHLTTEGAEFIADSYIMSLIRYW